MIADGIESFKQLEPNQIIEDLVAYIENQLPNFPASKQFADMLVKKKNENQHSSAFCNFMTCNSSTPRYYFERETSQKGSRTIDIGVYVGSSLIYTIEAKLLPTPKGTKAKPRNDHEYVYGDGAGIQRFKDEYHGVDHQNNLLLQNAMIAYVKDKDFSHWIAKINQWITDASWDISEQLEVVYLNVHARLKSKHIRKSKSEVYLQHFWITVPKDN